MRFILLLIISLNVEASQFNLIHDFKTPLWGFDFITNEQIVFTAKKGKVFLYNTKSKKNTDLNFSFPKLFVSGQGGLLDIKVHQKDIYITYSYKDNDKGKTTALFKGNLEGGAEVIYLANAYSNNRHHFGSRIEIIGNDLFMTIGDRGLRNEAQNKQSDFGKILKFNLNNITKKPEIHSYGHRNPQGITYHPAWKILLNGEFGPQGGDEINVIEKNKNYGWPVITYGEEYGGGRIGKTHQKDMEQPLKYWVPSLSFSGIHFYTSKKHSKWKDSIFLACLKTTQLYQVKLNSKLEVIEENSLLKDLKERIRMVRSNSNGDLYIITDSGKFGLVYP